MADLASTRPISPLPCSAFASLTAKSPIKLDHLLTLIVCQIVTGGAVTEDLGSNRAFRRGWAPRFRPCCSAGWRPGDSFGLPAFPTNMETITSHEAGTMAIEKCIDEFDVDQVIFEEGSAGRELFVVLEGKVDIAKISAAGRTG